MDQIGLEESSSTSLAKDLRTLLTIRSAALTSAADVDHRHQQDQKSATFDRSSTPPIGTITTTTGTTITTTASTPTTNRNSDREPKSTTAALNSVSLSKNQRKLLKQKFTVGLSFVSLTLTK